jgi:hypothetical protein
MFKGVNVYVFFVFFLVCMFSRTCLAAQSPAGTASFPASCRSLGMKPPLYFLFFLLFVPVRFLFCPPPFFFFRFTRRRFFLFLRAEPPVWIFVAFTDLRPLPGARFGPVVWGPSSATSFPKLVETLSPYAVLYGPSSALPSGKYDPDFPPKYSIGMETLFPPFCFRDIFDFTIVLCFNSR